MIVNYKYIVCQQKLNSMKSTVIICFILTPFLSQPSTLKLQNFTTPNECVCVMIWRVFHICDKKYRFKISLCVFNDYSLIADLHLLVYGSAECATISLECTMVKLLILNNFEVHIIYLKYFLFRLEREWSYTKKKFSFFTPRWQNYR